MPYVPNEFDPSQDVRDKLDPEIEALAFKISQVASGFDYDGAYAGLLNYAISRIAAAATPARRYWSLQLTKAVLDGAADEFKRRIIDVYENEQIRKNGDVKEYRLGSRLRGDTPDPGIPEGDQ